MLILYTLFIKFYFFAIRVASIWNKKAAAWIEGRKTVFEDLENSKLITEKVIWVHCSSAGEFEQGKPVIEALKKSYPSKKILVSFFSPSGYRAAKNYAFADFITYLPLDTKGNAERFFRLVNPQLVIFVKYEFWYHHLATAAFHQVPILLISAVFRQNQVFFQWYGQFFKRILHLFYHLFVQDQASLLLLQENGFLQSSISGDTRFDRVLQITTNRSQIPFITEFIGDKKAIVAGSTWPGDEEKLANYIMNGGDVKLLIVPHEINAKHIERMQGLFPTAILYSSLLQSATISLETLRHAKVLIIDSVGLLSQLYRYATVTYVGGGFTRDGIHNILEAAVWRKPVVFGPNYHKYREGREMIETGGAFSFSSAEELKKLADDLLTKDNHLQEASSKARDYIQENTGATATIMQFIQEKRLLTN